MYRNHFCWSVSWLVIILAFQTVLSQKFKVRFLKIQIFGFVKSCLEANWFNCLLKEALPRGSICGQTLASPQVLSLFFHLSFSAVLGMEPWVLTCLWVFIHGAIPQPGPSFLLLLCSLNLRWSSGGQQPDLAKAGQRTDTSERLQRALSVTQRHVFGGHLG